MRSLSGLTRGGVLTAPLPVVALFKMCVTLLHCDTVPCHLPLSLLKMRTRSHFKRTCQISGSTSCSVVELFAENIPLKPTVISVHCVL